MAAGGAAMLKWDHWHIEPSSICILQCPRCPRAEVPETLLNRQLTLNFFKTQIGEDTARNIRKITFCGNDGDPIYCRDLIEICIWLKTLNPTISIVIITNGSRKPVDWWQYLAKVLTKYDEIHWSLDGWDQHSNEQYRVGCDWTSIVKGLQTFRKHNLETYTVWASIAFRFNQSHTEQQKTLARTWGFDLYQLTKSTKFGSKYPAAYGSADPLEPTNPDLVADTHRFERVSTVISQKDRPGKSMTLMFQQRAQDLLQNTNYSALCMIGNKGVFLNSQGEFYPCCWTANRYEHNQSWQGRFNLNQRTFQDILADPFWSTEFLKFSSLECQTKCVRERLTDFAHTTEW